MGLKRFSELLGQVASDPKEAPCSASPGVALPGSLKGRREVAYATPSVRVPNLRPPTDAVL